MIDENSETFIIYKLALDAKLLIYRFWEAQIAAL